MALRIVGVNLKKQFLPVQKMVVTQLVTKLNTTPKKFSNVEGGRIQRKQPGKVLLGFLPKEWGDFFYEKTGVTGFYTFLTTFGCYLVSKEKYVMEHDYYGGLGMLILWILVVRYVGPGFAKSIDKGVDAYENDWNTGRENHKKGLEMEMEEEKNSQKKMEVNLMVVDAQKEAIAIQQEIEYRKRFMKIYEEVMKRLNYQSKLSLVQRQYTQKNLLDWIRREVLKVITPEWNNKYVDDCINILDKMPKTAIS